MTIDNNTFTSGSDKCRVCAAIVTFNRLELLKGAIESVMAQSYPCDILVVNNGSPDGTKEYLENLGNIHVINQENTGGAGGFNTALRYIAENGYELAWVMDDDIVAYPDCLSTMIERYDILKNKGERIGFLCSNVENTDGLSVNVPQIDYRPNATGYTSWNQHLGDGLVGVLSATFVSVLIPTSNLFELGLPYKEFFIWGDDSEFTLRLSKSYPSYQVGASHITHLRYGANISIYTLEDKHRIKLYRNFVRNHMLISRKGYFDIPRFPVRCFRNCITLGRLLLSFQFYKAKNFFIGFYKGFSFNPEVEFPSASSKL